MKRNALLSTVAALLAVQGVATIAEAADQGLPVKAPVAYVRVCTVYGVGFLYVPGTSDACIKIGGYVRLQVASGASGDGIVAGASSQVGQGRFDRADTDDINYVARATISLDMRYATEMGVLRGYFRMGPDVATPLAAPTAPNLFWDRGYIQFVGFTLGRQRSMFDIFSQTDGYTYINPRTNGDTDLAGVTLAAYTAQFGNGASATLSVEDPGGHNKVGVVNAAQGGFNLLSITTDNGLGLQSGTLNGLNMPDVIANLRVDQSWGYLGLSGALHQVAGAYYGSSNNQNNGHPADRFGWAAGAGGMINVGTGGDTIGLNFVASEGAVGYAMKGEKWDIFRQSSYGVGWAVDGVFDNQGLFPNSSIELTKAYSINGAAQHIWSPKWKTSVYGGYVKIEYDQNATNIINQHLPTPALGGTACGVAVLGAVWPPLNVGNGVGNSCSPNFSFWQVGTRTQFNPVTWLDLGVDVSYTHLNTAYKGPNVIVGGNGAIPAGTYGIDDQNVLTVMARAQLNFWSGK
jgi:Porin subfamily